MARAISVRERAEKSTDIGERDKAYGEAIEFYRRAKLLYLEANEQFKKSQNTDDIIQALKDYGQRIYNKAVRISKQGVNFLKNNGSIKTLDEFLERESEKYGSRNVTLSLIHKGWMHDLNELPPFYVMDYQVKIYVKSNDKKRKIKVLKYNTELVLKDKVDEIERRFKSDILKKINEKGFSVFEEAPKMPTLASLNACFDLSKPFI